MALNVDLLTNEELFNKLKYHGLSVGPVTDTTRGVYLRKLRTYLDSSSSQNNSHAATETTETSTPDIIEIKSTKSLKTQTDYIDDEDNTHGVQTTTSPKVPFEFRLLDSRNTTPVKGGDASFGESNLYPRIRPTTQASPITPQRYNEPQQQQQQQVQKKNNNGINVKLYFFAALVLVIVWYLYSYIQETTPKNPITNFDD